MNSLIQDLRFAFRAFRRRPGFTFVVVATLALGIGANAAIFSVANAVLFAPLPYKEPQRLVLVWARKASSDSGRGMISAPDYLDLIDQTTLFDGFAGAFALPGTLTGEGRSEQLMMGWNTGNFFRVLGIRPILGRDFGPEDEVEIRPADFVDPTKEMPPGSILLSHGLWQRRFGASRDVLGRTLELDGQRSLVVGVLPADFRIYLPEDAGMPTDVDVWRVLPVNLDSNPREAGWVTVVGRMKPGVTLPQAQAEADAFAARLREQFQFHANAGTHVELNSMHDDVVSHLRTPLYALLAAGAFVLLISCANVANLMLSRAAGREREIAVRAAMGAGRRRLAAQMLVESGILSVAGGLIGLGLAWGGIRVLLALRPDNIERLEQVRLDGTVLLFALAITIVAALAFGLVPAFRSASPDLAFALKERGSESGGVRGNKLRAALVVAEVALSVTLLVAAGLLARSFAALNRVEPGFRSDNVVTFSVPLPMFKYREPHRRTEIMLQVQEKLAALPGVEATGGVTPLPLGGLDQYFVFSYGRVDATEEEWNRNKADYRWVTPGYLEAMSVPLVAGRRLTAADNRQDSLPVAVVDEKLARRAWPGEEPVGQQLRIETFNLDDFSMARTMVRVVGVVGQVRAESLASEGREAVYLPHISFPFAPQTFAARVGADPIGIVRAAEQQIQVIDPDVPLADVRLMADYVDDALAQPRFTLALIVAFAVLALILASIGLYGVIAVSVRQRTQEIGVRMAFGAQQANIRRLVVGQGIALVSAGVAVGLVASLAFNQLAASLLFDVTAADPITFVGVSLLLLIVAAAASYLPARRAMRVDPLEALRGELKASG